MCGIVAVCSSEKDVSGVNQIMFTQMLYADVFRGPDATGFIMIDNNGPDISYMKDASPSFQFLHGDAGIELSDQANSINHFIGHNRWASLGGYGPETAHPFDFPGVIGVHNGTVYNHRKLCDNAKFLDSDSQAIYQSINDVGVDETVKNLDGSFALLFFDKQEEEIRVVRNDKRPMFFTLLEDKKTVIFSSEKELSDWIITRNKLKIDKVVEAKPGVLYSFPKDNVYEWSERELELYTPSYTTYSYNTDFYDKKGEFTYVPVNRMLAKYTDVKVGEPFSAIPLHFQLYPDSRTGYGELIVREDDNKLIVSLHGIYQNEGEDLVEREETIKVRVTHGIQDHDTHIFSGTRVLDVDDLLPGPGGVLITKHRWEELTHDGCAWCDAQIFQDEDIMWIDQFPVCPKCVEDWDERSV